MIAAVAAFLAGAVAISPAIGGPGFLTNKKASRIFAKKDQVYTKSVADATFLSKSEADNKFLPKSEADGRFLPRSEADGRFLPLSHSIREMVSPDAWVAFVDGDVTRVVHEQGEGQLTWTGSGAALDVPFNAALDLPQAIQGRTVRVESFELCYETDVNVTLSRVSLVKTSNVTNVDPDGATSTPIDDTTNRTDNNCRTYSGAGPVAIGANDFVQVEVRVDYATSGPLFMKVTRLSLNLSV